MIALDSEDANSAKMPIKRENYEKCLGSTQTQVGITMSFINTVDKKCELLVTDLSSCSHSEARMAYMLIRCCQISGQ